MSSLPNLSATAPDLPRASRLQKPYVLALVAGLWLVCVTVGLGVLWAHSHVAGELDEPPLAWPSDSALPHYSDRPTLVFFAHPQCPCTLASLRELDRLLADVSMPLKTVIVFVKPEGATGKWTDGLVWSAAEGIRGTELFVDEGCREAQRFAAKTSGQICLYDGNGRLMYHGGITSARGHEGDNTGRSAVHALLTGGKAQQSCPVYGCSLNTPATQPQ